MAARASSVPESRPLAFRAVVTAAATPDRILASLEGGMPEGLQAGSEWDGPRAVFSQPNHNFNRVNGCDSHSGAHRAI